VPIAPRWLACLICLLAAMPALAVSRIEIHVGDIRHSEASAKNLALSFSLADGPLQLHADELTAAGTKWRDVTLNCPQAQGDPVRHIVCDSATLRSGKITLPISFSFDLENKRLALRLTPASGESWAAQGQWHSAGWQAEAQVEHGQLTRLAEWASPFFKLSMAPGKGEINGKLALQGETAGLAAVALNLELRGVAFSDADGLHAGEKVDALLNLDASKQGGRWQWQAACDWLGGEVFWQPLYFASGGHSLKAGGTLQSDTLTVTQGQVSVQGVGQVAFSGIANVPDRHLRQLQIEGSGLQAGRAYELLAKPFLEKSLLGNLEVAGMAEVHAQLGEQGMENFNVVLHDFDVEDKNGRFAFYKVNADVPWAIDRPTQAALRFAGGRLLKLSLGAADLKANLDGWSLTAPQLQVPLLDGALTVQDVSAARVAGSWHWHLRADLSPVGLPEFSHAMGWPRMEGKLAAAIPLVTYSSGQLATDGAMSFRAFDGTVKVTNLAMQDPLGLTPRLSADLEMRNLDMGMLTRTFSFGAMTGRLDGDVAGLELSSWQPVKFDANFHSSPGDYPKKISQRAVENISALGGAGAAAAIQRSFLRFFKAFNYSRIGLSCRLRNGVCQMDGIEPAQQGYVIVKGSGVPAITVLGYNRTVGWGELLERVQRITQGNAKPVIK
jgi:hypothetical protein